MRTMQRHRMSRKSSRRSFNRGRFQGNVVSKVNRPRLGNRGGTRL